MSSRRDGKRPMPRQNSRPVTPVSRPDLYGSQPTTTAGIQIAAPIPRPATMAPVLGVPLRDQFLSNVISRPVQTPSPNPFQRLGAEARRSQSPQTQPLQEGLSQYRQRTPVASSSTQRILPARTFIPEPPRHITSSPVRTVNLFEHAAQMQAERDQRQQAEANAAAQRANQAAAQAQYQQQAWQSHEQAQRTAYDNAHAAATQENPGLWAAIRQSANGTWQPPGWTGPPPQTQPPLPPASHLAATAQQSQYLPTGNPAQLPAQPTAPQD